MSTTIPKLNLDDIDPESDRTSSGGDDSVSYESDETEEDTEEESSGDEGDSDVSSDATGEVPVEMVLHLVEQTFSGEDGYMAVIALLLDAAPLENRTGVGCRSRLDIPTLSFDCSDTFPLMTHKDMTRTFPMVLQELNMFMRGVTDTNELLAQKNRIWQGNTTASFLKSRGLETYEVGDMGPMYGFQWRHFGAPYPVQGFKGLPSNPEEIGGFDQLADLVHNLKHNPTSRRHMLTSYNPAAVSTSVLAPCHVLFVCSVRDGVLHGHLTQRSADWMLGVPFNIASYAMLLRLLARAADLKAGHLRMTFIDAHLYETHVPKAEIALTRDMHDPPKVHLAEDATWEKWTPDDVKLVDYVHGESLRMKMVA